MMLVKIHPEIKRFLLSADCSTMHFLLFCQRFGAFSERADGSPAERHAHKYCLKNHLKHADSLGVRFEIEC